MTDDVARHYEELLAAHYAWMSGRPFGEVAADQRRLLASLGVGARRRRLAVDLGCGPGYQAVALAGLGFARVLAVDTNAKLLRELEAHAGGRPVTAVRADIRDLADLAGPATADAVTCMGDTLSHLASHGDVRALLRAAHAVLAPGGMLVLTFRDLSAELRGLDRFIPVRADADTVMACFLEYGPDTVLVHDLVHVRAGGAWTLRKGSYRKLRLSPAAVAGHVEAAGLEVRHSGPAGGMWCVAAARPAG